MELITELQATEHFLLLKQKKRPTLNKFSTKKKKTPQYPTFQNHSYPSPEQDD